MFQEFDVVFFLVAFSTLCALLLSVQIWKSDEKVLLKLGYSFIVLIPIMGPVVCVWLMHMPDKRPKKGQVRYRWGGYYQESISRDADRPKNRGERRARSTFNSSLND